MNKRIFLSLVLPFVICAAHAAEIPNGSLDQVIQFVGMQSADPTAAFTGGTTFTVKYIVNGGTLTTMTTPTVTEKAGGCYVVLMDESGATTIPDANDTANLLVQISHTGMVTVWREAVIRERMATIAEIQADLALESKQDTIIAVSNKVDTMLESDGSTGYQFTALAVENAPSGSSSFDPNDTPVQLSSTALTAILAKFPVDANDLMEVAIHDVSAGAGIGTTSDMNDVLDENPILVALDALAAKLDSMIRADGAEYEFDPNAVEEAPTGTGSGLTAQQTRDAMKLAPSAGAASAGSIDTLIATANTTLGAPVGASISADIASVKSDAGAAKTAAEKIDTSTELRTLLAGSDTALATAAALDTVDNFLDTEEAAILAIANKLDTALVQDGAVWKFTTNALEQGPSGEGQLGPATELSSLNNMTFEEWLFYMYYKPAGRY